MFIKKILFASFFSMVLSFTMLAQESTEAPLLLGEQTFNNLFDNKQYPWFKEGYIHYNYNLDVINQLKKHTNETIHFVVFGGTWCEDTQQLLPRFYKVVLDAGFNERDIYLYMLDKKKTCPTKNEEGLNITHLPTFIVYRNGIEIGRIIESVQKNIETDLLNIIEQ